jgi:hypothetical protein
MEDPLVGSSEPLENEKEARAAEFAKVAFANLKLRDWPEIKKAAEDVPLTFTKKVLACLSIFAAVFNLYVIFNNWANRPPANSTDALDVSKLIVFWVEFLTLLGMIVFTIYACHPLFPCLRGRRKVNGEEMGRIASIILTIGSFSIVKKSVRAEISPPQPHQHVVGEVL